jgi:hypothetical protein
MNTMLCDFVENLYNACDLNEAFDLLEKEVLRLGFDGVLYTYIPKPLIDSNFNVKPVYEVSTEYCKNYLDHYTDARYDRFDPLIQAVNDGITEPFTWWGPVSQSYRKTDSKSDEVIDVSRFYGIHDGITIPLMSDARGIAGASVTSEDRNGFDRLVSTKGDQIVRRVQLFHSLIVTNNQYLGSFVKPLFSTLSDTEIRLVAGLASGRNQKKISADLNRSEKYLEQVMLAARRKWSGVGKHDSPTLNRNQLLYYAGLLSILDYEDYRQEH